jgi:hypothetical protein
MHKTLFLEDIDCTHYREKGILPEKGFLRGQRSIAYNEY